MTRIRLLLVFLTATLSFSSAARQAIAAEKPAIEIESIGGSGGDLQVSATEGWEFSVQRSIKVTALGVWDHRQDGLHEAIPVGIWDAKGKLLTQTAIPAGDKSRQVKQFRYVQLNESIELPKGAGYFLGAFYTPATKENVAGGASHMTFVSDGTVHWKAARRKIMERFGFVSKNENNKDYLGGFGPNFLFTPAKAGVVELPQQFYRCRLVDKWRWEPIRSPVAADESHRYDSRIPVELFARRDTGTLTQIVLAGKPLGPNGFEQLRAEIPKLATAYAKRNGYRPHVRLVAAPWTKEQDILKAAETFSGLNLFTPYSHKEGVVPFAKSRDPYTNHSPDSFKGRFKDEGEYVTDRWTGLRWQKDGKASGKKNLFESKDYANILKLNKKAGWRLPAAEELATIFPATAPAFVNTPYTTLRCCDGPVEYASYWTAGKENLARDTGYVFQWYANGGVNNCSASRAFVYVRCVQDPDNRKS